MTLLLLWSSHQLLFFVTEKHKKSVKSVKKWGTNACSLVPQIWVTIGPLYKKTQFHHKTYSYKTLFVNYSSLLKEINYIPDLKAFSSNIFIKGNYREIWKHTQVSPFFLLPKDVTTVILILPFKEAIHTQSKSSGRVTEALSGQNKSIWVTNFCALDNLHPPQIAHGCICFNLCHWQYLGKFQRDIEIVTPTTTSVHYTDSFQFMDRLCCLFHPWIVWPFSAMRNLYFLQ